MTHEEIMKHIADRTEEAVKNGTGGAFGAAVVIDGEIIAEGVNQVWQEQDPSAHGEVVAIRNAAKKIGIRFPKGTILYTTSQSCPMCVAAALWAGVEKIYFGVTSEFDGKCGLGDAHVYAYLRGDENPSVMAQEQICQEYMEERFARWAEPFYKNKEVG